MENEGNIDVAAAISEQNISHADNVNNEHTENENESSLEKKNECSTPYTKPGYARIKQEFHLLNYKPKIQTEYLSADSKRKLEATKDEQNKKEDEESEPPSKKTKLKGRNKQRPRNEKIEQKDKLCPAIKDGRVCKFDNNCKFTHDLKTYLEKKIPDIDQLCPVYESVGFCRHGITCRFAKSHLGENMENLVNKDLFDKTQLVPRNLNTLTEEVRNKLWKRKYDFSKAMKSVKKIQNEFNKDTNKSPNESTNNTELNELPNASKNCEDAGLEKGDAEDKVTGSTLETCKDKSSNIIEASSIQRDETKTVEDVFIRPTPREIKKIDFRNQLFLAPLTTVGNLPFRRVCKSYGADITCSEMALASQLLKGKGSEWSLIKRHPSEDIFGVQLCGAYPDMMSKCAQVLTETSDIDFIDINCGCPIDLIFKKGSGSALMGKATKLETICRSMINVMGEKPLTVKLRTGIFDNKNVAHNLIPRLRDAGVSLVTIHGRSREQRYTKMADWNYIDDCANLGSPMPVFGNGDVLSYEDANLHMNKNQISGVMIARGALIKPWIFTEIKEQRHWDISSSERFDILKSFSNYGLEHWGSDHQGVETTRRFLLEWLSFLHRYIPVGVLEQVPQKINERPPYYIGRNDLETLMASTNCADWIKISEMLLGPVPTNFQFLPKHKANAYQ